MMKVATLLVLVAIGTTSAVERNPVSKVVNLLKDMQAQLEKEAEGDAEMAETMDCWCTTNDKEKSAAIASNEQRSIDLGAAIEEGTATSARLSTEIKATENDLSKNNKALDTATALRQKDLAAFVAGEKDMMQSISALKSALGSIQKHHGALLQVSENDETPEDSDALIAVTVAVQNQLRKHADLLGEVVTPAQKRTLTAFFQNQGTKYAPQGGEIFGILNNMKETFQANLAQSQADEAEGVKSYADMKAAKETEIAAGQTQLRMKTNQHGDTEEKLANDKQDLEDTTNTLAADRKFLATVRERCGAFDQEFAERKKTRQEEIQAVSQAMAILAGDDAHDHFTKSFAQFLQRSATTQSSYNKRDRVYTLLTTAAKKARDPALSALAMQTRLAAFGKIKDTLEKMIVKLEEEGKDEINHRNWCIEEMNDNSKITDLKDKDKEHSAAKIDDLQSTIDQLTAAINQNKADIAEMQLQMKRAGEDRELANKEFQEVVSDQRATQALLQKALDVLKGVYDRKSAAALLQKKAGLQKQEPPVSFKSYEKNENSGGVMGMIAGIIAESKAVEAEAIHAESMAQVAYEDFVKDTNDAIDDRNLDITNKSETRAQADSDKTDEDTTLESILGELQMLSNESTDLHASCDFILKNFEIKQATRNQEIDALKESIGILSGAKGFLQRN